MVVAKSPSINVFLKVFEGRVNYSVIYNHNYLG